MTISKNYGTALDKICKIELIYDSCEIREKR